MPKDLSRGLKQRKTEKDEWIVFPNKHEALVSQELFDEVQEIMRNRAKAVKKKREAGLKDKAKYKNPFEGKILCGDCGYTLRFMKPTSPGSVCKYACGRYLDKLGNVCSRHSIRLSEVEEAVSAAIEAARLETEEIERKLQNAREKIEAKITGGAWKRIRTLANEMEEVDQKRSSLLERYLQGSLGKEVFLVEKKVFDEQYEALEKESGGLRRKIEKLRRFQTGDNVWIRAVHKAAEENELSQALIDMLVECIHVYEGCRVHVELRFQKEKEEFEEAVRGILEEAGEKIVSADGGDGGAGEGTAVHTELHIYEEDEDE